MTRHTWRPGGATYYPMDGSRQCDPLEPDDVIAALDAMAQEIENLRAELDGRAPVTNNPNDPKLSTPRGPTLPCGGMTVNYVGSGAGHAVEPNTVYDSSAEHWSPWLDWRGGPVSGPLPSGTRIEAGGDQIWSGPYNSQGVNWEFGVFRFRYRADNPAGWVPRGKFIPPAELWDDGCPVRCEWHSEDEDGALSIQRGIPGVWHNITHIRLVARQPQEGLPAHMVGPDHRGDYWMTMPDGTRHLIRSVPGYDGYAARMAEAWSAIAARERARRAGS